MVGISETVKMNDQVLISRIDILVQGEILRTSCWGTSEQSFLIWENLIRIL